CGWHQTDRGTSRARSTGGPADRRWRRTPATPPSAAATSPPAPADRTAAPVPPPSSSTLLRSARQPLGPHLSCDVVEHAVDDAGRFLAAEAPCDLHGLVECDRRRDLRATDELEGSESQQAQVDARQPRQPPVLGGARAQRIDALALLGNPVYQR